MELDFSIAFQFHAAISFLHIGRKPWIQKRQMEETDYLFFWKLETNTKIA
jgi:hypothetical protein